MPVPLCPQCNHPAGVHNDAGSEPVEGLLPDQVNGFVPTGQMCCYAAPEVGSKGIPNWGSRICGCNHDPNRRF